MTLSRRKTLALIGGGTLVAASGASAAFLATRTPQEALAPWALAGRYGEIRRDALSWALLAPNPHNMQPWQAELVGDDGVRLWRDPNRDLPHTDPFSRQLTIGMGCFLELLTLAAAQAGFGADVTLFPDADASDGPVADITFRAGQGIPDPLFAQALARRSCKEPFEDRAIPADLLADVSTYADVHDDPKLVAALRRLTTEAFEIEIETPRTFQESLDVMRIGKREINATPDGIDLGGAFFDVAKPLGLVSTEALADLTHPGNVRYMAAYRALLQATPAYVALTSQGNTRRDQIAAGRRWLRLNLATTSLGLALHPVSQCLQEYPEMAAAYQEAHLLLAEPSETVQMLGRLGYGPSVPRTPRWPLDAKLTDA